MQLINDHDINIPLAIWGGCWDPWFCRGPQRQAPCVHFTKSISALQGRELPSTKSRTFHSKNIWQRKFMFSTNQEPHMCKHQNKSKNITCWVKTSKDDSVEICVRVDSVEMFCRSLIYICSTKSGSKISSKNPSEKTYECIYIYVYIYNYIYILTFEGFSR